MAEAIKVSAKDVAKRMTLSIEVKGLATWKWQVWIAMRIIEFGAWLAWLNVSFEDFRKPRIYYCKNCRKDFAGVSPNTGEDLIVCCSHCHYQYLVRQGMDGEARYVWPNEITCGYECDFEEPYGFVPEAGCPVHD